MVVRVLAPLTDPTLRARRPAGRCQRLNSPGARLRSTQNSLPSGSVITTQRCSPWLMSTAGPRVPRAAPPRPPASSRSGEVEVQAVLVVFAVRHRDEQQGAQRGFAAQISEDVGVRPRRRRDLHQLLAAGDDHVAQHRAPEVGEAGGVGAVDDGLGQSRSRGESTARRALLAEWISRCSMRSSSSRAWSSGSFITSQTSPQSSGRSRPTRRGCTAHRPGWGTLASMGWTGVFMHRR